MNNPNEQIVYVDDPNQQQNNYGYAPIAPQKNDKADLLDKIRPDIVVETIRHKLMGEELIGGEWKKITSKGLTAQGAWDIANLMLGVSSQNVALSNLKDADIRARTLGIIETAQYMMLKNWKEYGITGTDQLRFVHEIIISNTFITLKQPEGEGIRNLIKGVRTETAQVGFSQQKEGGFFSRIFRR